MNIGTIIFTTLCLTTSLIPFGTLLPKFAEFVLRDKGKAEELEGFYLMNIKPMNSDKLGVSAISMEGTRKELLRMLQMARENVHNAFEVFASKDTVALAVVEEKEEYIDYLNKEISKYITTAMIHETTESGNKIFNAFYSVTSNIERIGDHAINVAGYSNMIKEKNITFSEMAQQEIVEIQKVCDKLFTYLFENHDDVIAWHAKVAAMEQKIDDMTSEFRNNMFARIQKGTCSDEGSILFSEMLTDFERIGDHALNISDELVKIALIEK